MMLFCNRQSLVQHITEEELSLTEVCPKIGIEVHALTGRPALNGFLRHTVFQSGCHIRTWNPDFHLLSVYDIQQSCDVVKFGNLIEVVQGIRHAPTGSNREMSHISSYHTMASIMKLSRKGQSAGSPQTSDEDGFLIEMCISEINLALKFGLVSSEKWKMCSNIEAC